MATAVLCRAALATLLLVLRLGSVAAVASGLLSWSVTELALPLAGAFLSRAGPPAEAVDVEPEAWAEPEADETGFGLAEIGLAVLLLC